MRVPNKRLYKRSDLERFFAGLVIGAIISWGVFLIIYGELQHEQTKSLVQLEQKLERAEKNSLIWQEDVRELNKKMKKTF